MISTELTLLNMPMQLAAFKQYITEYECVYFVSGKYHTLIFYHNTTAQPYVMIIYTKEKPFPVIYVNYQFDDWSQQNCTINKENIISNNIMKFLEAIRQCKKSDKR